MQRIAALDRRHGDKWAEGASLLLSKGWLARMPADFQQAVLAHCIWHEAGPDTCFIHAGDERGGLFGIARGTANLALVQGHPNSAALHIVGCGYWAGHRPLLGRPRSISVVARTPVLWALVPQSAMQRLLNQTPHWWQHIAQLSEDNSEIATNGFADLNRQNSAHRAIAVLLRLGGCRDHDPKGAGPVTVRISQTELAAMAVMSRNTLNSVIKELLAANLVQAGYRSIILIDPARLRAMLESD